MNEKLIIKNFGPIKDVTINLNRVNVIIGKQSTGKSTIAKLVAIFKTKNFLVKSRHNERIKIFNQYNLQSHFKTDTFIEYVSKEYKIKYQKEKFTVKASANLNPLIKKYQLLTSLIANSPDKINETLDQREEVSALLDKIKKEFIYFPTERILISSLPSVSAFRDRGVITLPEYLIALREEYESCRIRTASLNIDFLGVVFKHQKATNNDLISFDGNLIPLSQTASGIQSIIPLVTVMESWASGNSVEGIFLIEEPESNVFPSTQYELVKYIVSKCLHYDDSVLLTTHSPYVLTSLNNLVKASIVGNKKPKETNKIIDKQYWIKPEFLNAIMLTEDGFCENIVAEDGLIMAEKIDVVSSLINEEYDRMLDIHFAK